MGGKSGGGKRPASPSGDDRPTNEYQSRDPHHQCQARHQLTRRRRMLLHPSLTPHQESQSLTLMHPCQCVAVQKKKVMYQVVRRDKDLNDWEAECVKFLGQLMKHTWINAERPKYAFHVRFRSYFQPLKLLMLPKSRIQWILPLQKRNFQGGLYQECRRVHC